MSVPFITRAPSAEEIERVRLVLSTFCDGTGGLAEGTCTLPGWRDYERVLAALLNGTAPETKGVFDVIVASTVNARADYGLSIKSKHLSRRTALADLADNGRVYMELSNSPAKFFDALREIGITEADFRAKNKPAEIGASIIRTVENWHKEAAAMHADEFPGRTLDLETSVFLVVSYHKRAEGLPEYQVHSFDLHFPEGIKWEYKTASCLSGEDPRHPNETLFDWYALSGGQLKYYPRASYSRYSSPIFVLLSPPQIGVVQKAARYFSREWLAAGGTHQIDLKELSSSLKLQAALLDGPARNILERASDELSAISGSVTKK